MFLFNSQLATETFEKSRKLEEKGKKRNMGDMPGPALD